MNNKVLNIIKRLIIFILAIYPLALIIYFAVFAGGVMPISKFDWLLPPDPSEELHMPGFIGTRLGIYISELVSAVTLIIILNNKKINWKALWKVIESSVIFTIISFSILSIIFLLESAFISPIMDLSSGVRPYIMLIIYLIPDVIAVLGVKYLVFRKSKKQKKKNKKS